MARRKKPDPAPWVVMETVRAWGAQGGRKRATRLTAEERQRIARAAAEARWAKARKPRPAK